MSKNAEKSYVSKLAAEEIHWLYSKPFGGNLHVIFLLRRFASIIELLQPECGDLILDVGCGTGWTSEMMSRLGTKVIGIDISCDMCRIASKRIDVTYKSDFSRREIGCNFLTGDAERIGRLFKKEVFDHVVFFECLHHLSDWESALEGAFDILKKGGNLVINEPSSRFLDINSMNRFGVLEKGIHPFVFRAFLKKLGFIDISIIIPHLHLHPDRRIMRLFSLRGLKGMAAGLLESAGFLWNLRRRSILVASKGKG